MFYTKIIIKFQELSNFLQSKRSRVKVTYHINGLSDGLHGFHVHEYGDLTDGYIVVAHILIHIINYTEVEIVKLRHVGDLGNILSKK